ncbi:hypothetical protein TNCV_3472241 [Trichonephila clavipes]|nr:hypothetical protein TNCV_3472241 [Trichonephila clavipes]
MHRDENLPLPVVCPQPWKRALETHVERSHRKALAHGMPSDCHRPIPAGPLRHHQDIPAESVSKNNSVPVTTPSCHVRTTNKDTLFQARPPTSGHINKLDMGWRNASRSVSQ